MLEAYGTIYVSKPVQIFDVVREFVVVVVCPFLFFIVSTLCASA